LTYEQHLSKNGGVFVSDYYYSGPNLVSNIMFEPQYFNDSGEELNINDGNSGDAAFFTPDQLSTLVGGLNLKFTGLNLIQYTKE
jgi:hypothetical protein